MWTFLLGLVRLSEFLSSLPYKRKKPAELQKKCRRLKKVTRARSEQSRRAGVIDPGYREADACDRYLSFGAREATIASKCGSPRSGSHIGWSLRKP
jgi:hypothetical protein